MTPATGSGLAAIPATQEFMSIPLRQFAYQPCGDLWLEFP